MAAVSLVELSAASGISLRRLSEWERMLVDFTPDDERAHAEALERLAQERQERLKKEGGRG